MALVRQWFSEGPPRAPDTADSQKSLAVELNGTVRIARTSGDRIEVSIDGRIVARKASGAPSGPANDARDPWLGLDGAPLRDEARVAARRCSSGGLAEADPFVWLQLLDDRGDSLTHDMFLGRGVGVEYEVRARIDVPRLADLPVVVESNGVEAGDLGAGRRSPSHVRLAFGLHARVVTRTYRNPLGLQYHTEVLGLELLAAGAELPLASLPMVPAPKLGKAAHSRSLVAAVSD